MNLNCFAFGLILAAQWMKSAFRVSPAPYLAPIQLLNPIFRFLEMQFEGQSFPPIVFHFLLKFPGAPTWKLRTILKWKILFLFTSIAKKQKKEKVFGWQITRTPSLCVIRSFHIISIQWPTDLFALFSSSASNPSAIHPHPQYWPHTVIRWAGRAQGKHNLI